ncbi:MAG: nucleotide-binding universal stress UspA family protein [Verrucomicrobiales bacterium]|jgi:nucleotide-binding universal stress UspA family protein
MFRVMIQRILVPLELSAHCESAIRHACAIARSLGAQVIGKVILDDPTVQRRAASHAAHAAAMLIAEDTGRQNRKEADSHIQQLLTRFRTICAEAGVDHDEAPLQGIPSNVIAEHSMFYDLVVHGFHGVYTSEKDLDPLCLTKVLGHTTTPFLIVPDEFLPIRNVLICYDGSLSGMRAMRDFALLIGGLDYKITVLNADSDRNRSRFLLDRAEQYLKAHGAGEITQASSTKAIREAIREEPAQDPDLIVIGLHSKRGVRDFFIGSLTDELIESGETALFLGS